MFVSDVSLVRSIAKKLMLSHDVRGMMSRKEHKEMKRPHNQAGFTLLELFVTIAAIIIMLLVVFFMRSS